MTELPSACPECGKTFRRWEFWFDEIGKTHLDHRCIPADVQRFQLHVGPKDAPNYNYTKQIKCARCGVDAPIKSSSQKYCFPCGMAMRLERARTYYRENRKVS